VPAKIAIKTARHTSGVDEEGGGGGSRSCGTVILRAVVVTLTETLVAELSFVVTVPGETLQTASGGAPAHVRFTVVLKPGVAAKLKV
jgi:diaminopimelate epimerase